MEIRVYDDAESVAQAAARSLAARLRAAVRLRGHATAAVSGGRTPARMLELLAQISLPWQSIGFWQVDERVAPAGDPARNSALIEGLACSVHLMAVEPPDVDRYARSLPDVFDVVHLGLGDDGHTASWPPEDSVIDEPGSVALSADYRGYRRMTLLPSVVNRARSRMVVVTGSDKAAAMRSWLLDDSELPISRIRRTDTIVLCDVASCRDLPTQD